VTDFGGGARELFTWFDRDLDHDCNPSLASDGTRRCLPSRTTVSLVYSDAACATPMAIWHDTIPRPRWGYERERVGCEFAYRLYSLGLELVTQMYFTRTSSGACSGPFAPGQMSRLLEVVGEEPPETFVRLDPVLVGTGRLRASGWTSEDGARSLDEVYDTVLEARCDLMAAGDNDLRCTPRGTFAQANLFADAACSIRLAAATTCIGARPYIHTHDTCGHVTRTYQPGPVWTGATYTYVGATCTEASPAGSFTLLADEVPASAFIDGLFYDDDEPSDRIKARGWLALDGTRVRAGWRDTARGEGCARAEGTSIGIRCLPRAMLATSLGDNACNVPIVEAATQCSREYVLVADQRGVSIHAFDETLPQPAARYTYIASCTSESLDASVSYVTGGSPIPIEDFVAGTLVLE
jgi:hypothetical protein